MRKYGPIHFAAHAAIAISLVPAVRADEKEPCFGDVTVRTIDAQTLVGPWRGTEGGKLRVGDAGLLPLEDILSADFPKSTCTWQPPPPVAGQARRVTLAGPQPESADGGNETGSSENEPGGGDDVVHLELEAERQTFYFTERRTLTGRLVAEEEGELALADTVVSKAPIEFPLDSLAGIAFTTHSSYPKAKELLLRAIAERLPGEDVLITRDVEEPKVVRGRIESIGPEQGTIQFGGRTRTFPTIKLYGVAFAAAGRSAARQPVRIHLIDGGVLAGGIVAATRTNITARVSATDPLTLPLEAVRSLSFDSPRVVFASELSPTDQRFSGRLHRFSQVGFDEGTTGQPIVLGGVTFARGVSMTSGTQLDYVLGEEFESFHATVGVLDVVRPLGSVEFQALCDGEPCFQSGLVTGTDPPKEISFSVAGVHRVTLIVDYADEIDLADHAVWADARFIRTPAEEGT